jgi:hydroxypyruvate isomerase
MNYRNIFKHIAEKSAASQREFVLGMEHGASAAGKAGEQQLIDAYIAADTY